MTGRRTRVPRKLFLELAPPPQHDPDSGESEPDHHRPREGDTGERQGTRRGLGCYGLLSDNRRRGQDDGLRLRLLTRLHNSCCSVLIVGRSLATAGGRRRAADDQSCKRNPNQHREASGSSNPTPHVTSPISIHPIPLIAVVQDRIPTSCERCAGTSPLHPTAARPGGELAESSVSPVRSNFRLDRILAIATVTRARIGSRRMDDSASECDLRASSRSVWRTGLDDHD